MSNERSERRAIVTGSTGNGALAGAVAGAIDTAVDPAADEAERLFDFGPDVELPETGPQATLPPWMADPAQAGPEGALPFAGQTISARLAPAAPDVPAVTAAAATAAETVEDRTPEPVAVPTFAQSVPAPRRRRKPLPADRVVIAAPAVVDGSPVAAAPVSVAPVGPAPLVPAQRTDATTTAPAGGADAPAEPPAKSTDETEAERKRRRRRWIGLAQATAIIAVGATVGTYAAGGLGFLENRVKENPPTAEASAWVLNNLAGAGSVAVPASLVDTLIQNGQDSDALTTYPDESTAPLDLGKNCCSFLVLVGGPGEEPGAGVPDSVRALYDRSRPAAVFTTDGGWTQVRQVLPGSAAKVAADLKADHDALVATGKSLIASGKVGLSDAAKTQLQNGEVDARVLLAVVAVALKHKITIASFPALPGETDAGILHRSVAISKIDGVAVSDGSKGVKSVKDLLAASTGVYRPDGAGVHAVDGVPALELRFDAPSPFGLLTLDAKKS
ncbi:hypothetical protein [Sporichthya polymorpha]|uniref:hypothetical protein n=1 Tax=Sporichthya polymorpha TaxID=35751 RepID=UPI00039F31D8|nr:hypothetical protein [Sporichthya polymorpha]